MDLPKQNDSKELQLLGRNDEHETLMTEDTEFVKQMQQRNAEANEMMNLTQAGNNAAQDADVLVKNNNEDWVNKKWRPAMGWMYMTVCICDFVIFPIFWSITQAVFAGNVTHPWQPLTLQGAGLFHIAMGAVLGIATYGRTKEKIEGVSNNSTNNATPDISGIPK